MAPRGLASLMIISVARAAAPDQIIAAAHSAAARNRAALLGSWHWPNPSPPSGCPKDDVCHANKCKHCGCAGRVPCPGPAPPPGYYPNCPNQVQCAGMPTAQVVLFNNNNKTAIGLANQFLEVNFGNKSSDWWRSLEGTSWSGPPLENSYNIAVFTMFNSQSRWTKSGQVAALSAGAEAGMKAFWFKFVSNCAQYYPGEARGPPLRLHDSENIDTVRHTGCYFGSATLAMFPEFANRTLPDKRTVFETAQAWEQFTHSWLGAKALTGFFDELGSSGYWTRTWPCIWALHTLSEVGSRVRQRAEMFIDLAMLEAELSSIAGVRAGQKSRDKKATCPSCSRSGGVNPALEHHMYTALTPQLYGDDMNGPVASSYRAGISTQQVGDYRMSNVSILVHVLGAAPETNGVFTMQNRMMGQINSSQVQSCTADRCAETLRPYPCACTGGGSWHALLPRPRQVHVVSHTPAYALAGVVFSPNDAFVANCQQRGTGLVFSNPVHSAVALPHLTGEKWGLVDQDVMVVQRCGSCNYGGPAGFNVFNASQLWKRGEWWFMTAGGQGADTGWAAMRPAWGGTNFTNATSGTAELISGYIYLLDTWSPLVIVAADAKQYNSLQNFTTQIAAAKLTVNDQRSSVQFDWHGRSFGFTPGPATWKGHWTLPTVDGKQVDVDPPFVYRSPHMNAELNSQVVTASYGDYKLEYNFADDTVTQKGLLSRV